jgi:hypothetical protein
MIPAVRAKQLEDQAAALREIAGTMLVTGECPTVDMDGEPMECLAVSAFDLEEDARDLERAAAKLRRIYH